MNLTRKFYRGLVSLGLGFALSAGSAWATSVGVAGSNSAAISAFLSSNGYTVTNFGSSASASAGAYTGLDAMVLVRTVGTTALANFVVGGGLLITEWDSSAWALNTANLLDADDVGGNFVATGTPITVTAAGLSAGLGVGLANPFSQTIGTEFFRSFANIGAGVDVLATRPGGAAVIIGGASGAGSTLLLGYDWQDIVIGPPTDNASEQMLLNALNYNAHSVPDASVTGLLAGFAMLGLAFTRRFLRSAA